MNSFARRRCLGIAATVILAAVILVVDKIAFGVPGARGFVSGWILAAVIVFLAAYNVRKMIPFLPLGSSSTWLQVHIYAGLLTAAIFATHVSYRLPTGVFECLLAASFLTVFASGVIGLFITRSIPRRLTDLGNEVIFEHIPIARRQLQEQIESLVLAENTVDKSSAVAEFYRDRIRPFVVQRSVVLSNLFFGGDRNYRGLQRAIEDHARYLDTDEQAVLGEVNLLVHRKHQLDVQFALQAALKVWLFVHIPGTYVLLIFGTFHAILVHAWSGGLS